MRFNERKKQEINWKIIGKMNESPKFSWIFFPALIITWTLAAILVQNQTIYFVVPAQQCSPGIDGGHVNEPLDPHLPADASHGRRELDVHILVGEVAGLDAPPHEVDDNVGVLDGPADGVLVLDFVGTEEDLAQVPNNLQERRERGSILIP